MVTIKDGCGCDPCGCDWKQKLKEAYSRAIQSVNKIGDETGRVYYPDGTGFIKVPLLTKKQIDSLAEIDGIKVSVDSLNETVPALETQVTGVTESLVSGVEVLNGTTAGKFKVRIEREKASLIDSNDYDLSKVNSIELIQGSGPAMVKAQLTLSDGTVLRSDDFLFTSESIGTDVYISSFTFKNGNVDGTISADIGLNNGTTLEANNFVVPTDPSVVSTITDLQTRVSAIEDDPGLNELKAAVADLQTNKADVENRNQIIKTKVIDAYSMTLEPETTSIINPESCTFVPIESESGKVDTTKPVRVLRNYYDNFIGDYTSEPLGNVALLNNDGSPKNFTGSGETWEEISLGSIPTNWGNEDRIKVIFYGFVRSNTPSSWSSSIPDPNFTVNNTTRTDAIEFIFSHIDSRYIPIESSCGSAFASIVNASLGNFTKWNGTGNLFRINPFIFNASGLKEIEVDITRDNISSYVHKMWRLKR